MLSSSIGAVMKFSPYLLAAAVFAGTAVGSGVAVYAAQPHMRAALGDLNSAASELQQAVPDKAGHRVNAMNLVNQAIGEVKAGMRAGRM